MTVQALIDVLNKSEGKSTTVYHFGYNDNGKKEDFMLYRGKLIAHNSAYIYNMRCSGKICAYFFF